MNKRRRFKAKRRRELARRAQIAVWRTTWFRKDAFVLVMAPLPAFYTDGNRARDWAPLTTGVNSTHG